MKHISNDDVKHLEININVFFFEFIRSIDVIFLEL